MDIYLKPEEPLGTIKVNGTKIYYAKEYVKAQSVYDYKGGYGAITFIVETINGKKVQYLPYARPYIYYVIAELPNEAGTFYGFYTTGYDDIYTCMAKEKSELHPKGFQQPIYGTVLRPDGSRYEYLGYDSRELETEKLKNFTGTYNVFDYDSYTRVEFTFNPGGVGTIQYVMPKTTHWATFRAKGSTRYHKNGRVKSRGRLTTGGYDFYLNKTASQKMKWTYADGKLNITPVGNATLKISGGVDDEHKYDKMVITASDKAFQKAYDREDYNSNEDVLEQKKLAKERWEYKLSTEEGWTFDIKYLGKKRFIVNKQSDTGFPLYSINTKSKEQDNVMRYIKAFQTGGNTIVKIANMAF